MIIPWLRSRISLFVLLKIVLVLFLMRDRSKCGNQFQNPQFLVSFIVIFSIVSAENK